MALVASATWALATSCSPIPVQKLDQDKFYKRDMVLEVDGIERIGALVAPRAAEHKIKVTLRGKADLFTFETCHREDTAENAGKWRLFGDRKQVERSYRPVPGLEDNGSCVVRMGGYERAGGRHSWGLVDFEDPDHVLPARIKCNGEDYGSRGVTVCQSKEGLIQEIIFPVEVVTNPPPECAIEKPSDRKTWRFKMPAKECVYLFTEVAPAGSRRLHRLTTIGYQSILIREQ